MRSSKRWGVWLAGLLLLGGAFTQARAGITKGDGELGFDFGVTTWDDDLGGQTAPMFKLRGGYCATRWFEIEGQIAYSFHLDEDELRGNGSADRKFDVDQDMTQVFVSGLFNFPSKSGNIIPYVLAGIGQTKVGFPNVHVDDTSSAWQAAVGSRFFYGDHDQVAFRIEVALISDDVFDQSSSDRQYAFGFTWRLGAGGS